jgi:phage recombination protein Bet
MAQAKKSTEVATREAAPATEVTSHNASLMARVARRFGVEPEKMNSALKQTAFKQKARDGQSSEVSNEQMLMLMVVADQYKLNPFTREIYAFPSENGIVPIVSVDGWIRIINERQELKSISFEAAPSGTEDPWITCTIERHDRSKPVAITEYLSECSRDTKPWNSHPRRMLRHKALIQCARVAFGFGGIFDPDEGERIVSVIEQPERVMKPKTEAPKAINQDKPAPVESINMDQATMIADKLGEEGVDLSLFLASFQIGAIEELPADRYNQAMHAIDQLSQTGAT